MAKALPIVGTVVGAIIGSIIPGVGTAVGAAIGGALGGLGASLLASPMTIKQQVQFRGGERDPHPVRRFACGRFRTGLAEVFRHVKGEKLRRSFLIASEPIEDFEEFWIYGDTHVTPLTDTAERNAYDLTSHGARVDGIHDLPVGNYDRGQVEVWVGLGDQTQFPQDWINNIGADVPNLATASWKGRSVWHMNAAFGDAHDAGRRWRGRFPVVELVVKGGARYDPTKDGTLSALGGSGTHRRGDSATWEYTRNAAASALHILRARDGLGRANRQILIDDWMQAIEDCAGSEATEQALFSENWSGSAPTAQVVDTDPGSGVWTYNRGSVQLRTGTDDALSGVPVCSLFSTDTDGTLAPAEYGRMGVYLDMHELGRSAEDTYTLLRDGPLFGGVIGVAKYRYKIYQADAGGTASSADQEATFMPPDAANITLVYDRGDIAIGDGSTPVLEHTIEGRYISFVVEGGEPNESDIEVGPLDWNTLDQSIRFAADGLVAVDSREADLLGGIVTAMAGFLSPSAGKMGIRPGVWRAPTETLSKALVRDFKWTGRSEPTVDAVIATYIDQDQGWQQTETRKVLCECGSRLTVESASYTLVIGDAGRHVRMTATGASVTLPPQSSVAWSAYDRVVVEFVDGGSVSAGGGVTITAPDGITAAAGEFIRLVRNASDDWRAEITTMDRVHPLDLPMVSSRRQATQVAKINARRFWYNRTCEGWWTGVEYKHRVGDTVTYNRTDLPIVNGNYMVSDEDLQDVQAPGGGMMMLKWMRLREDAADIYAFDAATEYDPLPVTTSGSSYTDINDLLTLDCYQEDYVLDGGGTAFARLVGEATVAGSDLSSVRITFEWQLDGDAGWTHLETVWLDLSESSVAIAKLEDVTVGATYNLSARIDDDSFGTSDRVVCGPTTITAPSVDLLEFPVSGELRLPNGLFFELP